MVLDPSDLVMSNKTVETVTTSSPKLEGSNKKNPKSSSSSRKSGEMKSSSHSAEPRARVSDNLKKSIAKELKSQKGGHRSRSQSSSPPARTISRSASSKSHNGKLKGKKLKKKNKLKKVLSDPSLHKRSADVDKVDTLSASDPHLPFHNITSTVPTTSEASKIKTKRRRSSKGTKKIMQDALAAAAFLEDNKISGSSEHTQSTKTSDSTSSAKPSSEKSLVRKKKKPLEKSSSSKGLKKDNSSPSSEAATSASTPKTSTSSPGRNRSRLLTFESIHGKSIHKPRSRRNQGNSENAAKNFVGTLEPLPPSPQPQHANLAPILSGGGKKKSVLKAKREKQLLKQQQEREEQEKKELKARQTATSTSPTSAAKIKDDCIHEVMDIVSSSNHDTKTKAVASVSSNDDDDLVDPDPDECSSQSSTCSIVSDGSFEKDDLLSQDSDKSDEGSFDLGGKGDQNSSFGQHSFTIHSDHELSPSKVSLAQVSPSDATFTPESCSTRDNSFKDTLMAAMASSMSALPEDLDEDDTEQSPAASGTSTVPKKSLLKVTTHPTPTNSRTPLRLVPKRAKSDLTHLSSGLNNLLRVKLPGQRKRITRQRSLTFNEKVRVKRIPCQAQICDGDTSDLWFQPEEYDAIKRKTMALIRAVQDDQTGGVTYCTRGLERYFSVAAVQEKRNDAWDSVLDEQEAQRSNSESFNADRLSTVYAETTRLSAKEATERGKLDEEAISRYTKKMRQNIRRTYSMPT